MNSVVFLPPSARLGLIETYAFTPTVFFLSDLEFLSSEGAMADGKSDGFYHLAPNFAAGGIYTDCLLDSLICQCYYNNDIVNIIRMMIGGHLMHEKRDTAPAEDAKYNRRPSSGVGIQSSNTYQIPVPSAFVGKSYGELFAHLSVNHKQIPIAIYRGVWSKVGQGPGGNLRPYVYTCPSTKARLEKCDRIFVLSIIHPEIEKDEGDIDEKKHRRGKSALPSRSMVRVLHAANPEYGTPTPMHMMQEESQPANETPTNVGLEDVMALLTKMNSKIGEMDLKIRELEEAR